jgi:hypothetical protein
MRDAGLKPGSSTDAAARNFHFQTRDPSLRYPSIANQAPSASLGISPAGSDARNRLNFDSLRHARDDEGQLLVSGSKTKTRF